MLFPYNKFSYLWPVRPENQIPADAMDFYERLGYWGQVKMNGDCTLIFISPEGDIQAWNRHGVKHTRWNFTEKSIAPFKALVNGHWQVYEAELLNNHGPVKDKLYVFDILVWNSFQLVGMTWAERQAILHKDAFPKEKITGETDFEYVITPNLSLAKNLPGGFLEIFRKIQKLDQAEFEGLVLKDPKQKMDPCLRKTSNQKGMVKCRRSTKTGLSGF